MNKQVIKYLIALVIGLLIITPVIAGNTITVNEKKIEGCSGYHGMQDYVCIIGEQKSMVVQGTIFEEYVVSAEDYDKIRYGDEITLEYDTHSKVWKVI